MCPLCAPGLCPGSPRRPHTHSQAVDDPGASWEWSTSGKAGSPQPSSGDWHASLIWEAFTATCRLSAKEEEENKSQFKRHTHTHIFYLVQGLASCILPVSVFIWPRSQNWLLPFYSCIKIYIHAQRRLCSQKPVHGLQSLKYLLSGPLQKKFTHLKFRPILSVSFYDIGLIQFFFLKTHSKNNSNATFSKIVCFKKTSWSSVNLNIISGIRIFKLTTQKY